MEKFWLEIQAVNNKKIYFIDVDPLYCDLPHLEYFLPLLIFLNWLATNLLHGILFIIWIYKWNVLPHISVFQLLFGEIFSIHVILKVLIYALFTEDQFLFCSSSLIYVFFCFLDMKKFHLIPLFLIKERKLEKKKE